MIDMRKRKIIDSRTAVSRSLWAAALPLFISFILVATATLCLMAVSPFLNLSLIPLIYLIPVIVAATRWGVVSALTTAIVSAASADFFFYEPLYSLWISQPQQVVDLILFLIV